MMIIQEENSWDFNDLKLSLPEPVKTLNSLPIAHDFIFPVHLNRNKTNKLNKRINKK
jgi:hypothetical protein